jgi:indolepyruvate ferredoxin oxidoreductase
VPRKMKFGPWMLKAFGLLTRFKGLRGTALDPFGYTEERRTERALIVEYEEIVGELLAGLTAANLAVAVDLARIPEQIRGYGHVKEKHLAAARQRQAQLLAQWRAAPVQPVVAEASVRAA